MRNLGGTVVNWQHKRATVKVFSTKSHFSTKDFSLEFDNSPSDVQILQFPSRLCNFDNSPSDVRY